MAGYSPRNLKRVRHNFTTKTTKVHINSCVWCYMLGKETDEIRKGPKKGLPVGKWKHMAVLSWEDTGCLVTRQGSWLEERGGNWWTALKPII